MTATSTHPMAGCFTDWRNQGLATYWLEGLLRQAVYGLGQGYEDLIDHDQWRHDPILAVACGGALPRTRRWKVHPESA